MIPTNVDLQRTDYTDRIYRTEKEKINAVVEEIEECHKRGQPVLVGTISIEKNEMLTKVLKRKGIPHNVLNAKFHEMEATVVTHGGQRGAVTIATNMAGRGTDIKLGEGVKELGGLHILGTERHESRRIDNQLRGRSGRQGDPGTARFYLSLDDDLLRLFGSNRIASVMQRMGLEEGERIEHKMVSKAIANAQKKVEGRNFEIRKHLLEYDDVMNRQRQYIYKFRDKVLENEDLKEDIYDMLDSLAQTYVEETAQTNGKSLSLEEIDEVFHWLNNRFSIKTPKDVDHANLSRLESLIDYVVDLMKNAYEKREQDIGHEQMRDLERYILLYSIDSKWKDHLYAMDVMKEGIHLRAYAEKNPLTEYKSEGAHMFDSMNLAIMEESLEFLFKVEVRDEFLMNIEGEEIAYGDENHEEVTPFALNSGEGGKSKKRGGGIKTAKIGRNDPCTCGSGKKYKNCHGR